MAPAGVQRAHQQRARPLAERLGLDQRLRFSGGLVVQPVRQPRLDQRLACLEQPLLEPNALRSGPLLFRETGVRRAAPPGDRSLEQPTRGCRVGGPQVLQRSIEFVVEHCAVELVGARSMT